MSRITESDIELLAIERLEGLGYDYVYAPEIAANGDHPERASFADTLLLERLRDAVRRINPSIPLAVQEEAIKEVGRINSPDLLSNNQTFHSFLTEGVKVSRQQDGAERGDIVWLMDFTHPDNNDFLVANQFTVIENHHEKRPDVILFVNGIPLVVLELKNPTSATADIKSAFQQLEAYKATIPSLFTWNAFLIVSDGLEARVGALSAGFSRFMAWKTADGKTEASRLVSQLETLIVGMLNKQTLLDLVRHFIVFESSKKEDPDTGITTVTTIKKLAAYHQYYAVNAAVQSTLRAATTPDKAVKEEPAIYGLPSVRGQTVGDRRGGVVWHTQGSGKSLSMVFYTGKIVLALDNPTIVVITDRNDLDDQLFDTFAACTQLLRQEPKQVESREIGRAHV